MSFGAPTSSLSKIKFPLGIVGEVKIDTFRRTFRLDYFSNIFSVESISRRISCGERWIITLGEIEPAQYLTTRDAGVLRQRTLNLLSI